jgi:hypothetical protein
MCTSIVLALVSGMLAAPGVLPASANHFTVMSWNVDSGDVDPQLVALRMAAAEGVGLWGLCSSRNDRRVELLTQAAGENESNRFLTIRNVAAAGRCLVVYDAGCFEPLMRFDLDWEGEPWCKPQTTLPPALVVRFRHHPTDLEFYFMVNCLDSTCAAQQVARLHEWAARQTLPVIAVGTYWFQYGLGLRPVPCAGRKGLTTLLSDGVFKWLMPAHLVKTYNSEAETIEDFVFVAHASGRLRGRSQIVTGPSDFSGGRPSHRPVKAEFTVLSPTTSDATRSETIAREVREIEAELDRLEAIVHRLP